MKYGVVIMEGAAGTPSDALDDRTPLEVATARSLAALARRGRVGSVQLACEAASDDPDSAVLTILGYDPARFHPGPAGVRAAAWGLSFGDAPAAICLDLLGEGEPGGEEEGLARDAGELGAGETEFLVKDLLDLWQRKVGGITTEWMIGGVQPGRAILFDRAIADWSNVTTTPTGRVMWRTWDDLTPHGRAPLADTLDACVRLGSELLRGHEVNLTRREQQLQPAVVPWLWGPARPLQLPAFRDRHGLRAAMFCTSDESAAIAHAAGWEVELFQLGNLAQIAARAARAIRGVDLACIHIDVPAADALARVAAIEGIDAQVIGPFADALAQFGDPSAGMAEVGSRILIVATRGAASDAGVAEAAPFLTSGAWIRSMLSRKFNETEALASDLQVSPGWELMEYFLRSGMVGAKAPRRGGSR